MHERDAHDFLFYLFCRQDDEPRPNTLTKAQKKSARSIFDVAVTALTHRLKKKMAEVAEARGPKARLGGTEWDDLCSSVAIDFEVHKKHLLQKRKTCYSRISRDNLSGAKTSSPLAAIEPIIVDVLKKKARMRQPVTMKEALAFANSLISGSAALEDLKDYHISCGRAVAVGQSMKLENLERSGGPTSSRGILILKFLNLFHFQTVAPHGVLTRILN